MTESDGRNGTQAEELKLGERGPSSATYPLTTHILGLNGKDEEDTITVLPIKIAAPIYLTTFLVPALSLTMAAGPTNRDLVLTLPINGPEPRRAAPIT